MRFLKRMLPPCLMALALVIGIALLMPKTQAAESDDFTYTVSGGRATITGYTGNAANLTIPDYLGNHPVNTIGTFAFQNNTNLQTVTIPNGITVIGGRAFDSCVNLQSINFPNQLRTIGSSAFYNCSSLRTIALPEGFYDIDDNTFEGCSNLQTVFLPSTITIIGQSAFDGCTNLKSIYYAGTQSKWNSISTGSGNSPLYDTKIYYNAERYTDSDYCYVLILGEVTIVSYHGKNPNPTVPASYKNCPVVAIGDYAFSQRTDLKSVTIPDSVNYMGKDVFYGCTSLEHITIPFVGREQITSFPAYEYPLGYIFGTSNYPDSTLVSQSYYYSTSATTGSLKNTDYYIPNSLKSVTVTGGDVFFGAFYNCSMLKSVTIGDGVTVIENAFYGCSGLESLTIPFVGQRLKTASDYYQFPFGYIFGETEYAGSTAVKQSYYGSSISSTTSNTFYIPSNLRSVTVTGGKILYRAFYGCSMLESITLPDSATAIGNSAFRNCTNLQTVNIPDGVKTIGDYAFYSCTSLQEVSIPANVYTIGDYAFCDCGALTGIWVHPDNRNYCSDAKGVLYDKTMSRLIQAPGALLSHYTVPESVRSICAAAFFNCRQLYSVDIPQGVKYILKWAFDGCSALKHIAIPETVTTIADQVFDNCTALQNVYYSGGQSQWDTISIGVQNSCLTNSTIHYNHTHNYNVVDPVVVKEPTCTQVGLLEMTCIYGDTIQDIIEPLGHTAKEGGIVTPATCTEPGCTTSACVRCGIEMVAPIAPLDHDFHGKTTVVEYCTQAGSYTIQCTRCEATRTIPTVPAGHNMVVASVNIPSCTEQGYTVSVCSRCGLEELTDYVDALGHDFAGKQTAVAPTCTTPGYTETHCTRCDATQTIHHDLLGHDFNGAQTVFAPTCTNQGYTETHCTRCDTTEKTDYVDSLGHNIVVITLRDPTCTEQGVSKVGTMCDRCQQVFVTPTYTPALGHTYADGACTNCGAQDPDYATAAGDINNDGIVDNSDVVYLLWYTLFPEENSISVNADFNKDGDVTNDDVVLLLWYTLFPETNPL